jgi:hypothetical protein
MGLFNSIFSKDIENQKIEILEDIPIKSEIKKDNKRDLKKISRREISFLVDDALSDFKTMYLSPSGFIKNQNFKINHGPPEFKLDSPVCKLVPSKVN